MKDITPLDDPIRYRNQNRRKSAKSITSQTQVASADFETIDGDAWLFSLAWFEENDDVILPHSDLIEFTESNPFTLKTFFQWISDRVGSMWRKGYGRKGVTHPYLYYWNLTYDASSIIKSLSDEAIDLLLAEGDVVVDASTHEMVEVEKKGRYFKLTEAQEKLELMTLHYLPRKYLSLKPMGALQTYEDEKGFTRKVGGVDMFDMAQFYGCSLAKASSRAVDDGIIEQMKLDTIDTTRINDAEYREENRDEILSYALVDSEVTLQLSWEKIQEFESQGVRMVMPYSLASVAERNLLDTYEFPTMDEMMKKDRDIVMMGWNSYAGGWFETCGVGMKSDVRAFDLASAYPYIMYHLPDFTVGYWSRGTEENVKLFWDWMNERKPFTLGFAECIIKFPVGHQLYPALKMSGAGCTMTPRMIEGWFCADEIEEFKKWGASIFIGRWCCHFPHPTGDYPMRDFVSKWYHIKYSEGEKEGTPQFNKAAYGVSKVCLNSCYGKLIQTTEDGDYLKVGKMWNPIYAAVITGATRARMAEFARLNSPVYAVATDGIVVQNRPDILIPKRPLEACLNLGEWEEETPDGQADLLAIMSGVYSLLGVNGKSKTSVRGNASYFIGREDQPKTWLEFCQINSTLSELIRDEANNPYARPYSLGEARVRGDYSLVNVFRIVKATVRVLGDSNKRVWRENVPTDFGELSRNWYDSYPHKRILGKVESGKKVTDEDEED